MESGGQQASQSHLRFDIPVERGPFKPGNGQLTVEWNSISLEVPIRQNMGHRSAAQFYGLRQILPRLLRVRRKMLAVGMKLKQRFRRCDASIRRRLFQQVKTPQRIVRNPFAFDQTESEI